MLMFASVDILVDDEHTPHVSSPTGSLPDSSRILSSHCLEFLCQALPPSLGFLTIFCLAFGLRIDLIRYEMDVPGKQTQRCDREQDQYHGREEQRIGLKGCESRGRKDGLQELEGHILVVFGQQ